MTATQFDRDELLALLKFELAFLEDGGYGRSVRTPWQATTIFRDSPSCLNFGDPQRPHPCDHCLLMEFVPPEHRSDNIPCHQILLNDKGDTIDSLYEESSPQRMELKLADWLRATIKKLEAGEKIAC